MNEKGKALLEALREANVILDSAAEDMERAADLLTETAEADSKVIRRLAGMFLALRPDICWEATGTTVELESGVTGSEYLWTHPDQRWGQDYTPRWLVVGDEVYSWRAVMDMVFTKSHKYEMVGDTTKSLLVADMPTEEGILTHALVIHEMAEGVPSADDLARMVFGSDDDALPN